MQCCIQWCAFALPCHHHLYVMEFGHLLTRSGLTYPEVSSKVCRDSFCQLGNSVSLHWVIYYEAFYLHVVSSFSCIPVICLKLLLFLTPMKFLYLFFNLSECILPFFSCISSLLLLELLCREFGWRDYKWKSVRIVSVHAKLTTRYLLGHKPKVSEIVLTCSAKHVCSSISYNIL